MKGRSGKLVVCALAGLLSLITPGAAHAATPQVRLFGLHPQHHESSCLVPFPQPIPSPPNPWVEDAMIWECDSAHVTWQLVDVGGGFSEIREPYSNRCLDVSWGSSADAVPVVVEQCWGGTNQRWRLAYLGRGWYEVHAQHSDKCLDVAWADTANRTPVVQATCWGGANQRWRFYNT